MASNFSFLTFAFLHGCSSSSASGSNSGSATLLLRVFGRIRFLSSVEAVSEVDIDAISVRFDGSVIVVLVLLANLDELGTAVDVVVIVDVDVELKDAIAT